MKGEHTMLRTPHLTRALAILAALALATGVGLAGQAGPSAANDRVVKMTPIGSHTGEFCRNDRAILFEDPTGVRILWDPGQTTWAADTRLGDVHAIVLSSVHSDHIGSTQPTAVNAGTCGAPSTVSAAPDSVTARVANAKNSAVIVGGEMTSFLGRRIEVLKGSATAGCPATGLTNEMTVPRTTPCVGVLRPGGTRTVRMTGASAGVRVAVVPAFHSNGIPSNLLEAPGVAPGTSGYGGNDNGAILTFTNGLTVYLGADTGQFGDMESIVRRYYRPSVFVVNMGDVFSMGPEEAAFATNELVKPRSVIPSHANEAATLGGVVRAGTRTERFIQQVRGARVVVPLSGVTREFDGDGACVTCP